MGISAKVDKDSDLERTNGDSISESQNHAASISDLETPNGGLTAWLQVAGAFCLYLNTW